jgi:hypothetical protein
LGRAVTSAELLPGVRDLYSRLPETYVFEPWELVHVLYLLLALDTYTSVHRV